MDSCRYNRGHGEKWRTGSGKNPVGKIRDEVFFRSLTAKTVAWLPIIAYPVPCGD
jgi:hypothetical protein